MRKIRMVEAFYNPKTKMYEKPRPWGREYQLLAGGCAGQERGGAWYWKIDNAMRVTTELKFVINSNENDDAESSLLMPL